MRSLILLLLCATTLVSAQSIDDKVKQRVDYQETPGIVVGLYENGKITYYAYGVTNTQTKEAVTAKTLFEIGSITKTFTTGMAAALSLEKKLSFSDPAQKYLPAKIVLPEKNGKVITLETLATASSGLPRMPVNFSPEDAYNPYIDYREEQLGVFLSSYDLTRDPGAQYEYSNLGMGLLGYILTRITEKPYGKLVADMITKPLHMDRTFISGQRIEKGMATGYMGQVPVKAWTWNDQSVLTGAGGIISSAEDMMKYMIAQQEENNTTLSKAFALTHTARADAGPMKIGYGWHIRDGYIVWHNGGTGGFRSFAGFDKAKKKAVIVLTNSNTGADDLGFHLLNDQIPMKTLKPLVIVSPDVLKKYVGTYELAPGFTMDVTFESEGLSIQATGQPKLNIYAESDSKFYLKVVEAKIEFVSDANGQTEKLILYQNGATIPGKKIK